MLLTSHHYKLNKIKPHESAGVPIARSVLRNWAIASIIELTTALAPDSVAGDPIALVDRIRYLPGIKPRRSCESTSRSNLSLGQGARQSLFVRRSPSFPHKRVPSKGGAYDSGGR